MSQLRTDPYINFQGQAQEALKFYQKALGGELTLLTFNDEGAPKPAGPDDGIMHGVLEADGAMVMGSDGMPDNAAKVGDNLSIALSGEDKEQLTKAFNDLSEGGTVTMPLKVESWGDAFGMFTDKYSINWMVNINTPKS